VTSFHPIYSGDVERAGMPTRHRCTSPADVSTVADQQQAAAHDDVDDDVTTTTSGSYVVDMADSDAECRRPIADIYEGVLV